MSFTTIKIPGGDAERVLDEHRTRYRKTGLCPFLIGGAEDLERIEEAMSMDPREPSDIIRASMNLSAVELLAARRADMEEFLAEEGEEGQASPASLSVHRDIVTGKIKPEVFLGFASIEQPWHLPAVLKIGNWNECPSPEEHCTFFRHWQESYGAEIVGVTSDTVECFAMRPPISREEAMGLAWNQYFYCADIVDQGVRTISNLAATLQNAPYWFFWWD